MLSNHNSQWAALRAEQQARHGAAIAYIRQQIGPGTEYANEIARAVLSDAGAYYELRELPEEFVGALGDGVTHRLVAEAEAREMLSVIRTLVEDVARGAPVVRALSLYVLYAGGSLHGRQGMMVFDYKSGEPKSFMHGAWEERLPRAFKLRLHFEAGQTPPMGLPRNGIVVFLAPSHTDGGQCLLATITRSLQVRDLSSLATPSSWAS
jgi:hypothetical protein